MSPHDSLALLLSFGYILVILGATLGLRRLVRSSLALRAFVHAAAGLWIVPTVLLFDGRWWAMLPPGVFVLANAIAWPRSVYAGFQRGSRRDWGMILFPAAVALCIGLWWSVNRRIPVVVGVLSLALGDTSASLVGRRWGRTRWRRVLMPRRDERRPRPPGTGKTVAGSAALFVVCSLLAAVSFVAFGGVSPLAALAAGAWVGLAGAMAEAVTPGRLDNLTLPLVTAFYADMMLCLVLALEGPWPID